MNVSLDVVAVAVYVALGVAGITEPVREDLMPFESVIDIWKMYLVPAFIVGVLALRNFTPALLMPWDIPEMTCAGVQEELGFVEHQLAELEERLAPSERK